MSSFTNSYQDQINLQLEIAILKKKILAFKPCNALLFVPSLMGSDTDDDSKYIMLPMPLNLSITYGDIVIPEGTRLLIQTVAGNYNDLKIVGFYDKPKGFNFVDFIRDYIAPLPEYYDNGDHTHPEPKSSLPDDYKIFEYDEIEEE